MREVKFRGKRVDNGEWVYGDLLKNQDGAFIVLNSEAFNHSGDGCDLYATEWYEVIPASIGEYTGLKDANGIEIYEGDIYHQGDENIKYVVVYHDTSFMGKQLRSSSFAGLEYWRDRIEVVGNIFKNKNLLEDKR